MKHRTMCCQNLLQIPTPDEGIAELCINEETSTCYKATLIGVTDSDSAIPTCCQECEHRKIVNTEEQHTCKHEYRPIEYGHARSGYKQCEKCGHISTDNAIVYDLDLTGDAQKFKEINKQAICEHDWVSITDKHGFRIGQQVCTKCAALRDEKVTPIAERFDAAVESIKLIADHLLEIDKRLESIDRQLDQPVEECKQNEVNVSFDLAPNKTVTLNLLEISDIKFSTHHYTMSFRNNDILSVLEFDEGDHSYFYNAIIALANKIKEEHWQLNVKNNTVTITL